MHPILVAGLVLGAVLPLTTKPATSLAGVSLFRASASDLSAKVDLGEALASSTGGKTLLVLGTHAADFNMIEVAQRARAFWPQLQAKGVVRCLMVINSQAGSCLKLAELLDLPAEFELLSDETGEAGRRFGVSRGFRPDDENLSPELKLFVVGIGLGPPWGTLAAVLPGFWGNPGGKRAWVEAALKQGQQAGRSAGPLPPILELGADGLILSNRFDDFPVLGGWGLRPFELATLRLQNLAGIQFQHYDALKPTDNRCLTQLGGCAVVDSGGEPLFLWVDKGLCDVPDFDKLLAVL
ncbi:hypothetical protein T492DRAFT_1050035 [Pavlovales sp. CCMP2436]|nr:hypothetical protein T492DRAFT_1050035 [Pavlovales sp. CCMP2436]|mmetsp:Transcript_14798/g.37364  ORF Transcript_14798/g.37364 Transcript_14798/m.37364 type:complete len:295 (-) Transcript_14798:125-1009(-)